MVSTKVRHTAVFNNAVQLIAHFVLNAQLIYNALLAHSVYIALPTHIIVFAWSIQLVQNKLYYFR